MSQPLSGAAFLGFALLIGACGGPSNSTERVQLPPRERFELVSGMLGARCGSLDCHGQVGRSVRIYSQLGLRQGAGEYPGLEAGVVSPGEVESNYRAVTTLEPEILATVVGERGKNPERLTLVRKARGSEAHKGGQAISMDSAADRCLLSWLTSNVDESACTEAALIIRPTLNHRSDPARRRSSPGSKRTPRAPRMPCAPKVLNPPLRVAVYRNSGFLSVHRRACRPPPIVSPTRQSRRGRRAHVTRVRSYGPAWAQ